MTIYLIQVHVELDGYNGPYTEVRIDEDYGYFTSAEDAQAAIDKIVKPQQAKYDAALKQHEADVAEYKRKREELQALGGKPIQSYPSRPHNGVDQLSVIDVKPGEVPS